MSDQPGRDQMRPGGGRGHGRASVFTAQRKPSQDLRQKYTQPTTAGEGWVGGGGPLCGGFSSLENISCECGRGSVPDCCLLLAEMAQCPGVRASRCPLGPPGRHGNRSSHPPPTPTRGWWLHPAGSAPNLVQQKLNSELDVLSLPKGLEKSSVPPGGLQAASWTIPTWQEPGKEGGRREGRRE